MRILPAALLIALVPVVSAQDTILFQDDFEAPTLQWSPTGLWHIQEVSQPCSSIVAPFPSGTQCAWFGQTVDCTFDTPWAGWGWTDGRMISNALVSLPATSGTIRLSLRTNSQGEDDLVWDTRTVLVRVDDVGNWVSLGKIVSSATWQTAVFDLSRWAGHSVRVMLDFWAGDGAANEMYGWFVDDLVITASSDVAIPFCGGDGQSVACPCGNVGDPGRGCPSSFDARGAILTATGVPSLTNDTLAIHAADVSPAIVTFFGGLTRFASGGEFAFGDGLRCVTGTVVRRRAAPDGQGVASIPVSGGQPLHTSFNLSSLNPTFYVQALYRNAANYCTSGTFNLTNGLIVTWRP